MRTLLFLAAVVSSGWTSIAYGQATKTWYFANSSGGNGFGALVPDSPQSEEVWDTVFSWSGLRFIPMKWNQNNSTASACMDVSTCPPGADPGDSLVTRLPFTGSVSPGQWTANVCLTSAPRGLMFYWRVWKSANADGSAATLVTSGGGGTGTFMYNSPFCAAMTGRSSPAATFDNEYVFFVLKVSSPVHGTTTGSVTMINNSTSLRASVASP